MPIAADNPYVKTEFTSIKTSAAPMSLTSIKDFTYDKNATPPASPTTTGRAYSSVTARRKPAIPSASLGAQPTRVTKQRLQQAPADASQVAGANTNVYWYSSAPQLKMRSLRLKQATEQPHAREPN